MSSSCLAQLAEYGVEVTLKENGIAAKGFAGLSDDKRGVVYAYIKQHKAEILAELRQAATPPKGPDEATDDDFFSAVGWIWDFGVEVYGRRFELGWRGAENLSEATIEQARLLVERHKDEFMGIAPLNGYTPDYALFCDEYGRGGCLSCKEYMPNETRFCRAYNLRFHGSEIVTVTIEETPANQKKAACYWSKGAAQ